MFQEKPKPIYMHDCTKCVFLGTHEYEGVQYDLYTCDQGRNWPTVLARFSSDGPDYLSGLAVAKAIEKAPFNEAELQHPLVIAKQRAKERGLVTRKDTRDL